MMRADTLRERISEGPTIVLDGALGTELERAGVATSLPLWSTQALLEAPRAIEQIHRDYVRAGADLLTAATFRTQRRTLAHAGIGDRASELTHQAVELARSAAATVDWNAKTPRPLVAGSAPPLEDCYRPDLVPSPDVLEREHDEHANNLASAGVDLILVETMNCATEAAAAASAAQRTGLPLLVSFACGPKGALLSGETLQSGIDAAREHEPLAVLVNCTAPSLLDPCLDILAACGLPFGVYPNLGPPTGGGGHEETCSPAEFADLGKAWISRGASLIGGCCGTDASHIRALSALETRRFDEP